MVNPLLPTGYDVVFWGIGIAVTALCVTAVASIIRQRHRMSSPVSGLWVLAVVALPVLASLAWFLMGNPRTHERPKLTEPESSPES